MDENCCLLSFADFYFVPIGKLELQCNDHCAILGVMKLKYIIETGYYQIYYYHICFHVHFSDYACIGMKLSISVFVTNISECQNLINSLDYPEGSFLRLSDFLL